MLYAVIALAIALAGTVIYVRAVDNAVDAILDQIAATAENEANFRAGLKKEMSKLHSYCEENAGETKKLKRRVNDMGEGTKRMDESINALLEGAKRNDKRTLQLKEDFEDLKKKQEEFDQLADESIRAQIDSEKAFAEGVRAITAYGAEVPMLNTKGLSHG